MKESRTKNAKKNIASGLVNKFVTLLFPFIIRTCILYYLSEEYLGLSSLFTSILQVLNMAELGFSSAIVYNMYKPISEKNYELVGAYLNYYKTIYLMVGSIVLFFGIICLPFLTYLINGSWPSEINIYLLYMLYLTDSSISYFLYAYKSSLLNALQKINIVNNIQTAVWTIKYIFQILCIVVFRNYYLFMIVSILSTIMVNVLCSIYVDKNCQLYKTKKTIDIEQKAQIKKQVGGIMIGKISDVTRNSFDSIILSAFLGLSVVAIYNNYYYIFSAIYAIMLVITQALQASVGNSIAQENVQKNYNDLLTLNFVFGFIICFCCVSLISLYQPFMRIWVGENMLLQDYNMILFCVYFFALNINNSRNLYFTGNGLWWKGKVSFIFEAISNLTLNIILGKLFGITGIIIATIITIFLFNYVIRTNILFKEYFNSSPKKLYKNTFLYFLVTILLSTSSYIICSKLVIEGIMGIFVYLMISILISVIFLIPFINTTEFRNTKKLLKKMFIKKEN